MVTHKPLVILASSYSCFCTDQFIFGFERKMKLTLHNRKFRLSIEIVKKAILHSIKTA